MLNLRTATGRSRTLGCRALDASFWPTYLLRLLVAYIGERRLGTGQGGRLAAMFSQSMRRNRVAGQK